MRHVYPFPCAKAHGCPCRSAFLLCIGFNIVLQFTASTVGEERIELIVDSLLKAALAAVPFTGSLN